MWENLSKKYVIANSSKINQLKIDLMPCEQGGLEVIEFYNKLTTMQSELKIYVKAPHCTCGKCKCGVGIKSETWLKKRRLVNF